MKALVDTETFDRMSTREELRQVLELLSDADLAEEYEILDPPDFSDSLPSEGQDEIWSDSPVRVDQAQSCELANLSNLFIERGKRTN